MPFLSLSGPQHRATKSDSMFKKHSIITQKYQQPNIAKSNHGYWIVWTYEFSPAVICGKR